MRIPFMWLEMDGEGALHEQVYRGNTVLRAYEQLLDEGYVEARLGAGTFIAEVIQDEGPRPERQGDDEGAPPPGSTLIELSEVGKRIVTHAPAGGVSWSIRRRGVEYDFRYGEPAYLDLPHETWCRLVGRHARRAGTRQLAYGGPLGSVELRTALAGYLGRARGVACTPGQILITHGSQQAIDLVARVLVNPGDRVGIEEPHYTGISLPLAAAGADSVPIPVDEEGLPAEEMAHYEPLRGVCITPSHQFPSGGVMPLARRLALLSWAERRRAFVLEDDYDGEYRYEGKPIPSLQSLDRSGTVLYAGTASKVLFPSLRIGWLVVPESLARPFELAKAYSDTGGATLEQRVLAEFIEQGHLERHVRRSRMRNAARRNALKRAVEQHLSGVAAGWPSCGACRPGSTACCGSPTSRPHERRSYDADARRAVWASTRYIPTTRSLRSRPAICSATRRSPRLRSKRGSGGLRSRSRSCSHDWRAPLALL
jgi:GntR family transcriptional regulator/MocR family aminotransferase